jgi:indolepyruvate decarboxylase
VLKPKLASDPEALAEAVAEAVARLQRAKNPVILADVEIHRFGLGIELVRLTEGTGIPVAVTILGKSVIGELHPNYLGVYEGAMGRSDVQAAVEKSDCLLMLGTVLTDVNLGIFTATIDQAKAIEATSETIRVGRHRYAGIQFADFVRALANAQMRKRKAPAASRPKRTTAAAGNGRLKVTRLFELINDRLEDDLAVVCDVGLCLFGAIDLVIHRSVEFIASAYYTSMGFAIPASVGVALANKGLRPLVLVGDGAFQMTGNELGTIARLGLDPIVIVLDNHGYTTERYIKDGPFNDILAWNYERMPELLGVGWGCRVATEQEFAAAWQRARKERGAFSLISVQLDRMDHCPALKRLGERMGRNLV